MFQRILAIVCYNRQCDKTTISRTDIANHKKRRGHNKKICYCRAKIIRTINTMTEGENIFLVIRNDIKSLTEKSINVDNLNAQIKAIKDSLSSMDERIKAVNDKVATNDASVVTESVNKVKNQLDTLTTAVTTISSTVNNIIKILKPFG
ncbi:p10 [Adoxophyes orana granulovirus]|uniref:p10 n=1 Tax=Adoxophyes orana granulovirus TaxID=170617 RepID=Q7TA02_GVAO|nr:p10 [Adoxophyes orana granulovirus]AAP85650.1 p10 [Adoxophyes orana granulovirus]AIW65159.1 p10 [Adoxophyes orana granulovirus]AIW65163.1 p10 [Adoxophyes orana granulovirus]